jgi:hypothetical protein
MSGALSDGLSGQDHDNRRRELERPAGAQRCLALSARLSHRQSHAERHDGSRWKRWARVPQDIWYLNLGAFNSRALCFPSPLISRSALTDTEVWSLDTNQTRRAALVSIAHSSAQAGSYFFIYGEHESDSAEYTPELHLFDLTSVSVFFRFPTRGRLTYCIARPLPRLFSDMMERDKASSA